MIHVNNGKHFIKDISNIIYCVCIKNKNGSRFKLRQDVNADTTKFTSAGRRPAFGKKDWDLILLQKLRHKSKHRPRAFKSSRHTGQRADTETDLMGWRAWTGKDSTTWHHLAVPQLKWLSCGFSWCSFQRPERKKIINVKGDKTLKNQITGVSQYERSPIDSLQILSCRI